MALVSELDLPTFDFEDPTLRGDRYHEAVILDHLGDSHHGAGEVAAAREAWRRAMAILNELDHPDAGQIRVKLIEAGAGSG